MADGVRGGSTDTLLPLIASDDVGGTHYQRVKLDIGADGASTPVTAAAPLPVTSGQLPASLGQKTAAASASVVLASDQGAVPVSSPGLGGGILQTVTTVGATAVALPATPLAGRATMLVQNVGATTIYLGTSTVTAGTTSTGGAQLLPGQSVPISLSSAVILYAISSAAGGLVSTLELAA